MGFKGWGEWGTPPVLLAGSNESLDRLDLTAHVGAPFLGQLEGVGQAVHLQSPFYATPSQICRSATHHPPAMGTGVREPVGVCGRRKKQCGVE